MKKETLTLLGLVGLSLYAMTRKSNKLVGGRGDLLEPSDVDEEELEMGIEVEHEHTDDDDIAEEIALDHLAEDPKYYTKLRRMESREE